MTGNKRQLQPGFTVVEMLVTVTLFALMSVMLSQIFISFNRLQRKIQNSAILGQDARFVTEALVRETRNKLIDYGGGVLPLSATELALVSQDGSVHEIIALKTPADAVCDDLSVNCLALSIDGGATWNTITSHHVNVNQFSVFVRPSNDPFVAGVSGGIQPFVTVHLGLQYRSANPLDNVALETQTTVSSRIYKR